MFRPVITRTRETRNGQTNLKTCKFSNKLWWDMYFFLCHILQYYNCTQYISRILNTKMRFLIWEIRRKIKLWIYTFSIESHVYNYSTFFNKTTLQYSFTRMGDGRSAYRILVGKPEGRRHNLEDRGLDGRKTLRWTLWKWDREHRLNQSG